MGELFMRPEPKKGLSWTGERFTTNARGEVEIEHLHRYFLARELCRGLDVMDVASGEGYGAALLAQTAKSAIGVELSRETVAHAEREYATGNLRFIEGDARRLPVPDASLDAVVSFETLEHFYEHDAFFEEVRRVLRPSGFLLVSTPDMNVYSPSSTEPNPYHVHELTYQEFEAALEKHFPNVAISGQRMLAGSVLGPTASGNQELLTFERRSGGFYESSRGVARAKYLLGVAAMGELPLVPASVFVESSTVEEMFRAATEMPALRKDSAEVRAELALAAGYARSLETALGEREQTAAEAQNQVGALAAELDRATNYARSLETTIGQKDKTAAELQSRLGALATELARAADYAHSLEDALGDGDNAMEEAQDRITALTGELALADDRACSLKSKLGSRDKALGEAQVRLTALSAQVRTIESALVANEQSLSQAGLLTSELQHAKAKVEEDLHLAIVQVNEVSAQLGETFNGLEETRRQLAERSLQLEVANGQVAQVLASSSWRLSAPLRDLSDRFPGLRNFAGRQVATHPLLRKMARRSVKAVWWTLTGQLGKRLSSRRSAHELAQRKADSLVPGAEQFDPLPVEVTLEAPAATVFGDTGGDMPADMLPETSAEMPIELSMEVPLEVQIEVPVEAPTAEAAETTAAVLLPFSTENVVPVLTPKELAIAQARQGLLEFLGSDQRIALVSAKAPVISVLVIVWNAAYFTLKCLRALEEEMKLPGTPPFEVIVFDNASSDETAQLLAKVEGVKVVTSTTNLGFLRGCNEGAAHASGEALLLLNSDAFVRPGALKAAWDCLHHSPDVGAVGARLVLTTGLLQEAGSIIWADASTQGYCRGMNVEADEALFTRDVGYCSGAFLLTPLKEWRALEGFDERFMPAYYEEVDYCLRLREKGLRVVYEPRACVDHFEFGSESKSGDAIAQSVKNQKILRLRHARQLREFCLPASSSNVLFARTSARPKVGRLLFIDNEVPFGALGSGYPRARAMLNAAADQGWNVTFFALHNPRTDWSQIRAEFRNTIEFIVDRTVVRLAEFLDERHGYYDAALVSRPDNMRLVCEIREKYPHLLRSTTIIYDAEALCATRTALQAAWNGDRADPKTLERAIREEIAVAHCSDAVICVNEQEAAHFRANLDVPVAVLSHAVQPASLAAPFEWRNGFAFVGRLLEENAPNWIGLSWFIREVWPLIRQQLPEATLEVAGHVKAEHQELIADGVRILGAVDDLSTVLDEARVFIAPIHFAAGIPIKVLEAAAAGVPVMATPLMAQQLDWNSGDIRTASAAADFAAGAVALHEDAAAWRAQAAAAKARVAREHSESAFVAQMAKILSSTRSHAEPAIEVRFKHA
ncbi:GT2 family glycosyltransferase/SAM-dependent methyltransferase/glycosyltransferase involved in cell wall biosynthesis/predicted nucleic acid-binding Zn-ribbon protein [Variovorax paradoxus]|uniref:methyltransferase domain-containing protein n=1 Tax=Variovorax paradoxus TaxID=34073 RepID=UPI002788B571|nr:methyltransferase domain-containing protein [Variovorax paradoxus]MDQ0025360.1 GT2 family glycosyltransferase/SAM-dependent methyltransferase/glycosyltransferase involved in cell wall biosynthesis/predicted nucleic acid-binding Zn-ribbon protein [Variovorax paradoxus]